MKIKKLLTHDGVFHADEIFAIALIKCVFSSVIIKVERTRDITTDDMEDPEIWVLDQGKVYNPELHNFDHHQEKELESTNVLVLEYLKEQKYLIEGLYERLIWPFESISEIDRNGSESLGLDNVFHVNALIRALNSSGDTIDPSVRFEDAVYVAMLYIDSMMQFISNKIKWKAAYDNSKLVYDVIAELHADDPFPVNWKEYATHPFLVERQGSDPDKYKWKLHSCDSKEYPIKATGRENFIHVNKFIAVYDTLEKMIESAKLQQDTYKDKPLKSKDNGEIQLLDKNS